MRRDRSHEMPFSIERGNASVEMLAVFEVDPAEAPTPRSYSSGGEPGCDASIASVEVYYVHKDKDGKTVRERRPELDDLVDEDELLDHAGEVEASALAAAYEERADAERDERRGI